MLEGVLASGKYDCVLTCGPERLMKRVADICLKNKVPCQASLERYMKCGVGLCGSCAIDSSGLRVCKDGPVFTAKQLENSEFGRYTRDKAGTKKSF
jgi:dihydroorotate dehydrogenase electron transfer subunit